MSVVSTRPGIIVRLPVKFPSRLAATSPITVAQSGATFTIGITGDVLPAGTVWLWQLKMALADMGYIEEVDAAVPGDINQTTRILWDHASKSEYGDTLSDFIVTVLGSTLTQTAYTNASGMTN